MELSIDVKRHAYGGLAALQDIRLDVNSGEIICVIGPSGCGKAYGAIALGVGSRAPHSRVPEQPHFITAATHAIGGALVPVPGNVLIRDAKGTIVVAAAGFVADGG